MKERIMGISAVIVFLNIFVLNAFSQNLKIAVIDMQRILTESIRGKEAKNLLEKEAQKKKEIIDTKKAELQKLIDELEKQRFLLSQESLQEKQKSIDEKTIDLRNMALQYQQELQQKDSELTKTILNEVQGIVEMIAKRYGFQMVVEKNEGGIIYFSDYMDITDKVLKEYDKRVRRKKH